jgi:hypothetical protein
MILTEKQKKEIREDVTKLTRLVDLFEHIVKLLKNSSSHLSVPLTQHQDEVLFFGHLKKLLIHGRTALMISQNFDQNQELYICDWSGVQVIARSCVEGAGIFIYIFYSNKPEIERRFLIDYTAFRSLKIRLDKMLYDKVQGTFNSNHQENFDNTKKSVEQLEQDIKNNIDLQPFYLAKTEKAKISAKKDILSGKFEPIIKRLLPSTIGLGPRHTLEYYQYASDHAHAGYLAIMQVFSELNEEHARLIKGSLYSAIVPLIFIIGKLDQHESVIKNFFDSNTRMRELISRQIKNFQN